MDQTVNTGAIAQGFAALAQALAPNYQGMIEADLARYKRDNLVADTGYRDALTGKVGVETDRLRADAAAVAAAREALAAGDMNSLGKIFAGAFGDAAMMGAAPEFVTGVRTTMDPGFVNSPTFSSVLTGTGVQPYQNTPGGVADALANTLAVTNAQGQTSRDVATIQGKTSLDVAGVQGQTSRDVQGVQNQGALDLQNDAQDFAVQYPNLVVGKNGAPAGGGGNNNNDVLDTARATELAKMVLGGDKAPPQIVMQLTADAMEMVRRGLAPDIASAVTQLARGYTPASDSWMPFDETAAKYTNPFAGVLVNSPAATTADNPAAATGAAPTTGAGGGTITVGGQTYTEGQTVTLRDGRKFTVTNGQFVQVQ